MVTRLSEGVRRRAWACALALGLGACGGEVDVVVPGTPSGRADMPVILADLGAARDMPDESAPDLPVVPQDMGAPADLGVPSDMDALDMPVEASDMPVVPQDMGDPFIGTACAVGGRAGVCLDVSACDGGRVSTPGFCPGPAQIQCCTTPAPDMGAPDMSQQDMGGWQCDPNAAPQPNAGMTEPPGQGGCPSGMIPIAGVCVDRVEAALVEVLPGGATRPWSPYLNPGTTRVRAVAIPQAVPQGYITGDQAEAACVEAGKRLCTSAEWLRACQGPQGWTYPYGNTRQPGVCHDARSPHPVVEYFGSSEAWVWSRLGDRCINQLPASLRPTGAQPGCVTAEGALDMMGNLHEWVSDASGTFRGGFYVDTYRNGNGCLYRTTAHNRQHWDYSTGFRCCADMP